ncbi:aminotransferase class IV [Kitasatospora sp. NPDC050543]|uniref:aminotransferase class IV n=1 Tax=Kitasatospora sp. NPDC050543 TaxID=3364054 RepID=UPI0037AA675D
MIRPLASFPVVHHAGGWTTWEGAVLHTSSITARYGVSLFEGVRAYRQSGGGPSLPFLLPDHIDRLRRSLAMTMVPDPGLARLPEIVDELVRRNEITDDAYLRIAVNAANPGGLTDAIIPQLTVTAAAMGRKRWLASDIGMALTVSGQERADARVFPPAAKNISNYAGPRLAQIAALEAGFDGCVLVNRAGRLAEAPTAAVFLVLDGELVTPSLDEDVLPSITRQWVLDRARTLGIPVSERPVETAETAAAQEAFLCGTGIEFAPIRSFDGSECTSWETRPVTRSLTAAYFREVRSLPARPEPEGSVVPQ